VGLLVHCLEFMPILFHEPRRIIKSVNNLSIFDVDLMITNFFNYSSGSSNFIGLTASFLNTRVSNCSVEK